MDEKELENIECCHDDYKTCEDSQELYCYGEWAERYLLKCVGAIRVYKEDNKYYETIINNLVKTIDAQSEAIRIHKGTIEILRKE